MRFRILSIISALIIGSILIGCANKPATANATQGLADNSPEKECVVLIHGLWRSALAMRSIESRLQEEGFATVNISYPSTEISIEDIANDYVKPGVDACNKKAVTTHIVTHSMGGVVARAYLQDERLPDQGKVVMLSPPNQGSELSEKFHGQDWFDFFAGKAATTLHADTNGVIQSLKPFPEHTGVIAGFRSWSLWPESFLPSPNDGMVSVESMALDGMDDYILMETGHAMMRYREEVQDQIVTFLKDGAFDHLSDSDGQYAVISGITQASE